jgi:hypothetical protein
MLRAGLKMCGFEPGRSDLSFLSINIKLAKNAPCLLVIDDISLS